MALLWVGNFAANRNQGFTPPRIHILSAKVQRFPNSPFSTEASLTAEKKSRPDIERHKGEMFWYSGYGQVPFDPKLFAKPEGITIAETAH